MPARAPPNSASLDYNATGFHRAMTGRTPSLDAFLGELALAWQRLVLYQPGHPSRAAAIASPHHLLTVLAAPVGEVVVGVTKDALVGTEERVDGAAGRKLAAAFYQAAVGVVRFREGVSAHELETLLQHLPRHAGWPMPRPLWEELAAAGVTHVVVEPLDLSRVRATDTLDEQTADEDDGGQALWDQILRKLMADEVFASSTRAAAPRSGSLAEVLRILRELAARHGATAAVGNGGARSDALTNLGAIVASVLTGHLAEHRTGRARRSTLQHLADLLTTIPEGLRERLLDAALGQLVQQEDARPDLDAFAGSVSAAQMVSSLRRLRGQQLAFSATAQALVEQLVPAAGPALVAEEGGAELAPDQLAAELHRLFADQDVDRAGPGLGDRLVLELPRAVPPRAPTPELEDRLESLVEEKQLASVAGALLELLQNPVLGPAELAGVARRIESVFRALLLAGRVRAAVNIVERLRAIHVSGTAATAVQEATSACLESLHQKAAIGTLIDALLGVPDDALPILQRLLGLLGPQVVQRLLLAMGEEEDLGRRRHTFDLLKKLGATAVPHAVSLLGDPRWFVVRNMLSLLRQAGHPVPLASLVPSLGHADARVRAEAVRCLGIATPPPPAAVISQLVADSDERVAESAVTMVGTAKLAAGKEPLLALLRPADPLGRHRNLRVRALAALSELGDPKVLDELKTFFRLWLPVVSADERKAAYASLARYPARDRQALLEQGLKSRDADVRAVCQQIVAAAQAQARKTP